MLLVRHSRRFDGAISLQGMSIRRELMRRSDSRGRNEEERRRGERSRYTVSEGFDVGSVQIRSTPKEASRDGATWKTLQRS